MIKKYVDINGASWSRSLSVTEVNEYTRQPKRVVVKYDRGPSGLYITFALDLARGGGVISGASVYKDTQERNISSNHPSMQAFVNDAEALVREHYPSNDEFYTNVLGKPS